MPLTDEPRPPPTRRLVDSITELGPPDQGCLAITGSHGGVSSARYALAVRPRLSVFNDAGVGRDGAGVAGLALLQAQGLAACAVAHHSACIGQAASTWADGVISQLNPAAVALGLVVGEPLRDQIERLGLEAQTTPMGLKCPKSPPPPPGGSAAASP